MTTTTTISTADVFFVVSHKLMSVEQCFPTKGTSRVYLELFHIKRESEIECCIDIFSGKLSKSNAICSIRYDFFFFYIIQCLFKTKYELYSITV